MSEIVLIRPPFVCINTFEHFIKQEKIYADKFFKNSQILNDKFDENEYCMIKNLWSNQDLINTTYSVIDDILKKEKLNENLRFLILSDLFFFISPKNLINPREIIFKILKNNYLRKIKLKAAIDTIFDCDYYKYIKIHQTLLMSLGLNNII